MRVKNQNAGLPACREHSTWHNMWDRCINPNNSHWLHYGGRGVHVTARWRDFFQFVDDMGRRPPRKSLDRIDVQIGYCPDNCRWATDSQQNLNKQVSCDVIQSWNGPLCESGMAVKRPTCREFNTWKGMWDRCINPGCNGWEHWGGRGITVCDRWQDFFAFMEDMGRRPDGMSLDRIDVNGNYEPGNCRWATKVQQMNNMRTNVHMTIDGVTKTMAEHAHRAKISPKLFHQRVHRDGMTPDEALRAGPIETKDRKYNRAEITIGGQTMGLNQWCKRLGISNSTVHKRVKEKGMTVEEALFAPVKKSQSRTNKDRTDWKGLRVTIGEDTRPFYEWCKHFEIEPAAVKARMRNGMPVAEALTKPVDKSRSRTKG